MARGNASEAIEAWVAGVRFAQHVPRGGSLLATLTGRVMLGSTMAAITRAVEGGRVDTADTASVLSNARPVVASNQRGADTGEG